MTDTPFDRDELRRAADEIITNVREFAAAGWTPATSSNFSRRLDDRHAAITVSGRDKGKLVEDDIMVVDFDGNPVATDHRPSAETLLHTQLYKRFPDIGCILHTHSQNQTIASRLSQPAIEGGRAKLRAVYSEVRNIARRVARRRSPCSPIATQKRGFPPDCIEIHS